MALIDEVKDHLQITWEDDTLTRKLENGLEMGKQILQEYAGGELDFDSPGTPKALLFEFERYVRSDAMEMFEKNYQSSLLRLRNLHGPEEVQGD